MKPLDADVNSLVMFAIDYNYQGQEENLAAVLAECLKTHGLNATLNNLKGRNQTGIISGLVLILEDFKNLRE